MSAFKQLGNLLLPQTGVRDDAQRDRRQSNLATRGRLETDVASVDSLTSEPADLQFEGVFRPPWLKDDEPLLAATELEEMAGGDRGPLPLFDQGDIKLPERGFYEIADAEVEPIHPSQQSFWRYFSRTLEGRHARHALPRY